ncbi:MAG: type I-MYXAN CRISPR-associated protein Cas6/Cmx6 [Ferrovum sp.]|nr:type I-MYXAN CRISPR-associated protein Cas6/Cmx6 [Ferrovum sp.]
MSTALRPMTDIAFALQGDFVPTGYARALLQGIVAALPWFKEETLAGILPLRGTQHDKGIWLPRRTKLVLRLPTSRIVEAHGLSGQQLTVGEAHLSVEAGEVRPHVGHPTLHAHLVASLLDEAGFVASVQNDLARMGISGQWICGKHHILPDGDKAVSGFSLVVHHLKPEQSLLLQGMGLGKARHLGCGIFVPFKTIPNLE